MNINLHIDRLIVEDIDLSPSERVRLQAAIEAELTRLLTVKGFPSHWEKSNWVPKLATRFNKKTTTNLSQLAQEIAQSIYTSMNLKWPLQELDFNRLAKLNLTGGSIHNVIFTAAFLAAHAGTPVTMLIILNAPRTKFRKLDRPINEAEFCWTSRSCSIRLQLLIDLIIVN